MVRDELGGLPEVSGRHEGVDVRALREPPASMLTSAVWTCTGQRIQDRTCGSLQTSAAIFDQRDTSWPGKLCQRFGSTCVSAGGYVLSA